MRRCKPARTRPVRGVDALAVVAGAPVTVPIVRAVTVSGRLQALVAVATNPCRTTTKASATAPAGAEWQHFARGNEVKMLGRLMSTTADATRVVHVHKHDYDVYIGRPSVFGNPFVLGKDGSRSEVILKYRAWLADRLEHDDAFREKVLALRGKRLGCYCVPALCHGHVLAEYVSRPETWQP